MERKANKEKEGKERKRYPFSDDDSSSIYYKRRRDAPMGSDLFRSIENMESIETRDLNQITLSDEIIAMIFTTEKGGDAFIGMQLNRKIRELVIFLDKDARFRTESFLQKSKSSMYNFYAFMDTECELMGERLDYLLSVERHKQRMWSYGLSYSKDSVICIRHVQKMCRFAARGGNIGFLQRVYERQCKIFDSKTQMDVLFYAAKGGKLDVLKWAKSNEWLDLIKYSRPDFIKNCSKSGNIEVLEWIRDELKWELLYESEVYEGAIEKLRYHVIRWAARNRISICSYLACCAAVETGNLTMLIFILNMGCRPPVEACAIAAKRGDLMMLQIFRERGYIFANEMICIEATEGGHLEILKWLISNGCPCGKSTFMKAASKGSLHILKWLVENEYPCDKEMAFLAAKAYKQKHICAYLNSVCH